MNVRNWIWHSLAISVFLLVSCTNNPGNSAEMPDSIHPTSTKGQTGTALTQAPSVMAEVTPTLQATGAANCASEEINRIGRSIAETYAFTTEDEVMAWFCEGAEFEDILMALETESLNGTPAEDMLEMRAEGLSWDDIWLVIGFVK